MTMEREIAQAAVNFHAKSPSFARSWLWVNILYLFPASLAAPLWDILFPDFEGSFWTLFHDWGIPFVLGNIFALFFLVIRFFWRKERGKTGAPFVPLSPIEAVTCYILPFAVAMVADIAVEAWWTVPPADRADYNMGSLENFLFAYGMELLVIWGLSVMLAILCDSMARVFGVTRKVLQETREKRNLLREEMEDQTRNLLYFFRWCARIPVFWLRMNFCYIVPGALIWPLWGFFMGNGECLDCLTLWLAGILFGNLTAFAMIFIWALACFIFRCFLRGFGYQIMPRPDSSLLQAEVRLWVVHNLLFIFPSALLIFLQGTGIFSLQSAIGDWDWGRPAGRTFFICLVFWGVSQVVSYCAERSWRRFFGKTA